MALFLISLTINSRSYGGKENQDRQCLVEIQKAVAKKGAKGRALFDSDCLRRYEDRT